MDYLERQAEESENEGDTSDTSVDEDEPRSKKRKVEKEKKKKNKKKRVESSDDDEDEDDDEEAARKEMAGFIADEDDEEDGDNDDDKSDKSGKSDEDLDDLDEDDLALIDENLDTNRKKKRVVQIDSDDEDDRTAIQKKLFGGVDDDGEGPSSRHQDDMPEDNYSDSERSEDNFIVHEDGQRPFKHRHKRKDLNVPEGALDEARDIFGVEDFNIDDFYDEDEEPIEDEDEEIMDEEGDEGGERAIRRVRAKEKKNTLLDTMEPSELDRGFLAPADKKIQLEDKPERFQLRKTAVSEPLDEDELDMESKWIYQRAFVDFNLNIISKQSQQPLAYLENVQEFERASKEATVVDVIKDTLRFIRSHVFEVPFIAFYRKETIRNVLTIEDLWKVYEYDEKWCHLQNRKNKLLELMRRMEAYLTDGAEGHRRMIEEADFSDVIGVNSSEQLADVWGQFHLYYGPDIPKMQDWEKMRPENEDEVVGTRFKHSSRNDRYQMCVEMGIGGMASRFGLNARQFAGNLDAWHRVDIMQDEMPVMVAAQEYVSTSFPDPDTVIAGAIFMLAKEFSRQPVVRDRVRRMYRRKATFSCRPTQKGREILDDTHPIWPRRYIKDKPVSQLEEEEYLWYHQLKVTGHLDLKINCDTDPENPTSIIFEIMQDQPFIIDEYSDLVQDWNLKRNQVVIKTINEMLLPHFEQEVHLQLLEEARQCVTMKCSRMLAERLNRAAFKPTEEEMDDEDEEFSRLGEVRVMGICYPDDMGEASFGVMVDQDGSVLDYVRMLHFLKRGFGQTGNLKAESMNFFKKFVERKRPHIIGLAAENMEALRLKRDLEDALNNMVSEGVFSRAPAVVLVDNDICKVYMNSKQSMLEHPDYPPVLRQAISLARIVLDPVIEYSHLWNVDEDILCLSLHPLQSECSKDELSTALSREVINVVNDVGVDVNKCLEHGHLANMLQFVAGLGPRKAVHLLKTIKQHENLLESRTKLVTVCRMGPKVFMNCAGFIKIDTTKVAEKTDDYVEVLDGSRVHPETYEWARKMAVDALEVDDTADPTAALEEILQGPERLKDLDLDAFAAELERQGFGHKRDTLYDISAELNHRYNDRRPPYIALEGQALFDVIMRGSKETIVAGKRVQAVAYAVQHKRLNDQQKSQEAICQGINWYCPHCGAPQNDPSACFDHMNNDRDPNRCPGIPTGVRIRLDNGFTGFIPNKFISDSNIRNPLDRIQLNRPLWVRIINVDAEKFSCLCSSRSSDLQKDDDSSGQDSFYDRQAEQEDREHDISERSKRQSGHRFFDRVIQHPNFHNVNYSEAQRLLAKLDQGDAVVRPSKNGVDRLTVTWKVVDGIYANVEVQEELKDQPFSLGKRLLIGTEEFEDLNEILARYIQPMASYAREIVQFKYFIENIQAEDVKSIEAKLKEEKKKAPAKIPYILTVSPAFPGKFRISYRAPEMAYVMHEYMTVTPEGIRFRGFMFTSFDKLIGWFKIHYLELPRRDMNMFPRRTDR